MYVGPQLTLVDLADLLWLDRLLGGPRTPFELRSTDGRPDPTNVGECALAVLLPVEDPDPTNVDETYDFPVRVESV